MGVALDTEHLKRYRDLALLLWKYGRSDLVKRAGLEDVLEEPPRDSAAHGTRGEESSASALAEQLADDLERLGPTYIKLGQVLSTRGDLLPLPVVDALTRLQDHVEPFPFAEVEAIVCAELGVRLSKAFSFFDTEPLAAASLGQVHRATMRDGRQVVVKVQRPGIRKIVSDDLDVLASIAAFADKHTDAGRRYGFADMVAEFRTSLIRELDYRQEARNLLTLRKNLEDFDRILVPAPIDDYTTSKVLTMEYVSGVKVTALSPVARTELDGAALADQLFNAYLKQVLVDGFVHADPHPGNVFLTDDGRIALIDLGMVARIQPSLQEKLLHMLLAVTEGRGEAAANVAVTIGVKLEDFDEAAFRRVTLDLIASNHDARAEDIEVGKTVLMLTKVAADCGLRAPPEMALLGKTLLSLDKVGRTIDPGYNPNQGVREASMKLLKQRMGQDMSKASLIGALIDAKDFAAKLPSRVGRILDKVAENEIKITVDAIDEQLLMRGFQKVANRITLGLVLAALIVGASLLMRVETTFRILGYPGLAMLLFLAAAGAAVLLIAGIFISDRKTE